MAILGCFFFVLRGYAAKWVKISAERIAQINNAQFENFEYYRNYMPLEEYKKRVEARCQDFVNGYPQISWQGWNLADYMAYRNLRKQIQPESQLPE
ncbi:MAG: hypothetical protein AB9834_03490 [Lentimicrobium sp.]